MERAGNALCNYACHHWPDSRQWWIFVGPGNNGGDGYVLACLARRIGLEPLVIAARAPGLLREMPGGLPKSGSHRGSVTMAEDLLPATLPPPDLVIDALLGTGVQLPLLVNDKDRRNNQWLERARAGGGSPLRSQCRHRPRHGALVRATRTLTFIGIKQGMLTADGVDGVGHLDRDPLGVTPGRNGFPLPSGSIIPASGVADPRAGARLQRDTAARYC